MSTTSPKGTVPTTVPAHDEETTPDYCGIPKDFWLFPVPKRLRYDHDKPFHFGTMLNIAFGFGSTLSECCFIIQIIWYWGLTGFKAVANIFYCQPILSRFNFVNRMKQSPMNVTVNMSISFDTSYNEVSR